MTTVILSTMMSALAAYVVVLHARLHQAQHDPLTGLDGRALWHRQLARWNRRTMVAYFDVDDFKSINDTYGHAAGDLVLVETAHRIRAALPRPAVIARLGGDEFAAMWQLDENSESTHEIVARLQRTLSAPVSIGSTPLSLSVSVGLAVTGPTDDPWDTVAAADKRMYQAKHPGSTHNNASVVRKRQRTRTLRCGDTCAPPQPSPIRSG